MQLQLQRLNYKTTLFERYADEGMGAQVQLRQGRMQLVLDQLRSKLPSNE
jgi:hypothetical protein